MLPVVVWPSAEKTVLDHLYATLPAYPEAAGVKVGPKLPQTRSLPYVIARRSGGPAVNLLVERPRIDLHCYHQTDAMAERLAQVTRGVVLAMPGVGAVRRVEEFSGLLPTPDDDWPGAARVWFTVELTLRGSSA